MQLYSIFVLENKSEGGQYLDKTIYHENDASVTIIDMLPHS